jgi:hypothetical protein
VIVNFVHGGKKTDVKNNMADKMSVEMNITDNNSENLIETFRQIVRIYYDRVSEILIL